MPILFSISTLVVDRQTDKTIIEAQIDFQATEQISQILNDAGYTVISCVLTNA